MLRTVRNTFCFILSADKSEAVERGGCFPGWARVTVVGGRQKTLSSLASGDRILALSGTGQVVYSQVLLFLHRDQESRSVFLSLEADGGNRLVVTPHHLVFLDPDCGRDANKYRAEFASRARVGDCVLIGTPGGQTETSRIISVSLTESVGVFAPLTEAGTLFVDGVLVSSYALLEDHDLAHWAFGPLRLLHSLNHFFGGEDVKGKQKAGTQFGTTEKVSIRKQNNLSEPLRMKDQEQCSLKTSEIHWYARLLYRFASIFLNSNIFHA